MNHQSFSLPHQDFPPSLEKNLGTKSKNKSCEKSLILKKSPKTVDKKLEPRLMTRKMKKIYDWKGVNNDYNILKCSICLMDIPQEEEANLPCGHFFCLRCIANWWQSKAKCPCCRKEFAWIKTKDL